MYANICDDDMCDTNRAACPSDGFYTASGHIYDGISSSPTCGADAGCIECLDNERISYNESAALALPLLPPLPPILPPTSSASFTSQPPASQLLSLRPRPRRMRQVL